MRINTDNKVAWLLGFESDVGKAIYSELLKHPAYSRIHVFSKRQRIKEERNNVVEHIWKSKIGWSVTDSMKGHDLFVCYDKGHFKKSVVYKLTNEMIRNLPEFFTAARTKGEIQQVIISSHNQVNDNAFSEINRVRALIEIMIRKLNFWAVHMFRPVLVVENLIKDRRKQVLAKLISKRIGERTEGWFKKNRPIESDILAKAMIDQAQQLKSGVFEYKNAWLQNYLEFLEKSKRL